MKQADIVENFSDIASPLTPAQALLESNRCYYCYDAPCLSACPTEINIPSFIRKISTNNNLGAAKDILNQNIMGATCARACPVEVLCEQACVRNIENYEPVNISALQRYATDWLFEQNIQPFSRAPATGKKIAVVGAGPAGMACAHRLACLGHDVVVYEARAKAGGLNEYGIATYKMTDDIAQRELDFILAVGGIELKTNHQLGKDLSLSWLRQHYDAVFLGLGLAAVNSLNLADENINGVINAVDYIAQLRQVKHYNQLAVGRRVVVIGGGNTAVDIASQIKRLGAEEVTIVYRSGQQQMSATTKAQHLVETDGVLIHYWAKPIKIVHHHQQLTQVRFEKTKLDTHHQLIGTGEYFEIAADMLFKAIGQYFLPSVIQENGLELLELTRGRIAVDAMRKTSLDNVYAGGDCIYSGQDLTVQAVQDGKIAAAAIHQQLT